MANSYICASICLGMCYAFYVFTLFDPNKSFHKNLYTILKMKNVKDKQFSVNIILEIIKTHLEEIIKKKKKR